MGNMECGCRGSEEKAEKSFPSTFEGEIARHVSMIKSRLKENIKAANFEEFINKRGSINIEKEYGMLTQETLTLLHSYKDEWVYLRLREHWKETIQLRRKNLDNFNKYAELYRLDIDKTAEATTTATKALLKYHGISSEQYSRSLNEQANAQVDSIRGALIWKYYSIKTGDVPKVFSIDELLDVIDCQMTIANNSEEKLRQLKFALKTGKPEEKNELAIVWVGDMMWNEDQIKMEDYILNLTNPAVIKNLKIQAAKGNLNTLLYDIQSDPVPLTNPYRKDFPNGQNQ